MKKYIKMLVCCFLSFTMISTSIEWSGIAGLLSEVHAKETETQELRTVIDKENTKNSTTFQLSNGKKQTVFYGQDVRFENEDGQLEDYDPSLINVTDQKSQNGTDLSGYQYENKTGDKKHYLPKKLTEETPVLMENGKYQISFAPILGKTDPEKGQEQQKETDDASGSEGISEEASEQGTENAETEDNAFSSIQKLKRQAVEEEEVLTAEDEKEQLPVKVSYASDLVNLFCNINTEKGDKTINYYYQDGVVSYTTDGTGNQTSQNLIGLEGNIIGTQRYSGDHTSYYTYNKDNQGSTTSLVKEDGTADATYQYTDFGETTVNGDNKADNEVCYTGGIYDSTTGLYYLNARYYNPEDGRFLTEDTYRGETNEPDTWHLYAYCKNDPVNYVDPSGHWVQAIPYLVKLIVGGCVVYVSYKSWKRHTPKTRYNGKRVTYKQTIFWYVVVKVIKHKLKKSQHGHNNVRKTGTPSNRQEEIRDQKADGTRNKRKRAGYKKSKNKSKNK